MPTGRPHFLLPYPPLPTIYSRRSYTSPFLNVFSLSFHSSTCWHQQQCIRLRSLRHRSYLTFVSSPFQSTASCGPRNNWIQWTSFDWRQVKSELFSTRRSLLTNLWQRRRPSPFRSKFYFKKVWSRWLDVGAQFGARTHRKIRSILLFGSLGTKRPALLQSQPLIHVKFVSVQFRFG